MLAPYKKSSFAKFKKWLPTNSESAATPERRGNHRSRPYRHVHGTGKGPPMRQVRSRGKANYIDWL
jgi:hypothetical protein